MQACCADKIKYRGKMYKKNFFLTKSTSESVLLYEIENVILYNSSMYLICKMWHIEFFSDHYQAFILNKHFNLHTLHSIREFDGPPIHVHILNDEKKYFRIKKY